MTAPFGIYIHFPYCRKRCPYCDFAVSAPSSIPHQTYRDKLLEELSQRSRWFAGRTASSIYVGGGTPSLWQASDLASVLRGVQGAFAMVAQPEITVECDPLDLLEKNAHDWELLRATGVNRLSLGLQSSSDAALQQLGRLHTAAQGRAAVHLAQKIGFSNISADLMIGLPQQTEADVQADVQAYVELGIPHVSVYQLTVEPHTAFAAAVRKKSLLMPDSAAQAQAFLVARNALESAGLAQYEVASYARSQQHRSQHNQLYWTLGEYLGLGVSAHSFRRTADGGGERFSNGRSLRPYLQQPLPTMESPQADTHLGHYEHRSEAQLRREAVWLGLRRIDGISRTWFRSHFGEDLALFFKKEIQQLQEKKWLCLDADRIWLTPEGILFSDEVALFFL